MHLLICANTKALMNNIFDELFLEIQDSHIGVRVDKVILACPLVTSRSQAGKLFREGLVTLNGKALKPSYPVKKQDQIKVSVPQKVESLLEPHDRAIEIVHQDEDVIVINKPPGLVMHPSAGHETDSLVNVLIHLKVDLSMGFNEERPGIVHRIDKDTSGLVVVAKNNRAHEFLAQQFQEKRVHRVYYAIVYGEFSQDQGTIENYLVRHPVHRKKYTIERLNENSEPKGKKATTHFKALNSAKGLSLVECKLQTGRTHQIRVHMSENQHPIISDPIYSSSRWLNSIKSKHVRAGIKNLEGIGLHAKELGFIHPTSQQTMLFKSSWPDHLLDLIQLLGWENE